MARTKPIWAFSALSMGVLGHAPPSKANYTNTAQRVPHSVPLVGTLSIAPTTIPLPTFSSPEDELYGTRSSTASLSTTSGPCETEYTTHYLPEPVATETISYGSASSLKPSSAATHASSPSPIYTSLPAYSTYADVKSTASTWLPPSYTVAIPYYPSNPVNSTRLPYSCTVGIPLPPSSTAQETISSFETSSDHYPPYLLSSKLSSSVPSHSGTAVLPHPTAPSSLVYSTNTYSGPESNTMLSSATLPSSTISISLSLPQSSNSISVTSPSNSEGYPISSISLPAPNISTILVTSPPVTIVIPVPPVQTSSIVANASSTSLQSTATLSSTTVLSSSVVFNSASTSKVLEVSTPPTLSSSAAYTVIVSTSSQSLPTSSLETPSLSSAILSVPSSSMTVVPSSLASASSSKSSAVAPATSSGASSVILASTLQGVSSDLSFSTTGSSSTASSTVNLTSYSTLSSSQTTRPTAAGSSVRYTLSISVARSSSAPAETITGVPPAPPVQTGAAKTLGSSGKEKVWWASFLLPLMLCL